MDAFLKTGKVGVGSGVSGKEKVVGRAKAVPWVEKYRPRTVTDVAYQDQVVALLKKSLSGADLPNLLFYGPPGTGKTSTILAAARDLFGDIFNQRILELNASDERGIQVIRDKVKNFAQQTATGKRSDGKPTPPYKIIILDEADSMTEAAQQALRRTMELYSSTTRFALACNSSEKIIEPIQSRCAMLRYSKLSDAQVLAKVLEVCKAENIDHSDDGLEAVVFTAQGDMRQALNNLQSTHEGFGFVKSENVFKVCDEPHPLLIKDMLDHCVKADIDESYKLLLHLWKLGYSSEDIVTSVFRVCKTHNMAEFIKLEFIKEIGLTHLALVQGTQSLLQLSGMLARLCQVSVK